MDEAKHIVNSSAGLQSMFHKHAYDSAHEIFMPGHLLDMTISRTSHDADDQAGLIPV